MRRGLWRETLTRGSPFDQWRTRDSEPRSPRGISPRSWPGNRLTVAHEHVATAISQLVMALAYSALPRGPSNGRRALVACVDDELHDLGARMAADFFEMGGFDVRYLGANLPADGLVGMVRE